MIRLRFMDILAKNQSLIIEIGFNYINIYVMFFHKPMTLHIRKNIDTTYLIL